MGSASEDDREEVIQAWYMDDSDEDQRLPHHRNPKEFVTLEKLAELGVLSWRLDADNYETDEELKKIREARGYSYTDFCEVCPEKLPNYEVKIKNFFEEHLHTDEEIRYCVGGSGYFDVRDHNDGWIRVWVKKGGMIVLPAGIYHRFTLDTDNYIKAMRLFVGDPIWTPFNRPEELRLFLQVDGKLPLVKSMDVASRMLDGAVKLPWQLFSRESMPNVVDLNEVAQPAKGGRDLLRIFKELKQSVTNDWGGTKPPAVEEDKEFLERRDRLQDFENHISNTSQQAEFLVKAQQDIGETMGQLGLAFVKLTKFETDEAQFNSQRVRSADMKNVATAAVKASRLYRELNAQTVKHLDKLHDYLGVMLAVNNAFSDRSNALLTVQTLLSELSSLNSRIEKLEAASSKIFGGDRSRIRKIEELKETVRVTEDAKSCAVREYERIKENNKTELERLDKERRDDFLSMLKGFVVNQVGYAEKMANVWEMVAEETSVYAKDGI